MLLLNSARGRPGVKVGQQGLVCKVKSRLLLKIVANPIMLWLWKLAIRVYLNLKLIHLLHRATLREKRREKVKD